MSHDCYSGQVCVGNTFIGHVLLLLLLIVFLVPLLLAASSCAVSYSSASSACSSCSASFLLFLCFLLPLLLRCSSAVSSASLKTEDHGHAKKKQTGLPLLGVICVLSLNGQIIFVVRVVCTVYHLLLGINSFESLSIDWKGVDEQRGDDLADRDDDKKQDIDVVLDSCRLSLSVFPLTVSRQSSSPSSHTIWQLSRFIPAAAKPLITNPTEAARPIASAKAMAPAKRASLRRPSTACASSSITHPRATKRQKVWPVMKDWSTTQ